MSTLQNPSTEANRLRAELKEKCIQIEAMSRFEEEVSFQFNDILKQRDSKILELESRLDNLSLPMSNNKPQDNSGALLDLLNERERELIVLEEKVREIMSEREELRLRESISDSIVDYETRVEGLRHELIAKDSEIRQLRSLLENLSSPSISPSLEAGPDIPPIPQEKKCSSHSVFSVVGHKISVSPPQTARVEGFAQEWSEIIVLRSKLEELVDEFLDLGKSSRQQCMENTESILEELRQESKTWKRILDERMNDLSSSGLKVVLIEIETAFARRYASCGFQSVIRALEEELDRFRPRLDSLADSPPINSITQIEERKATTPPLPVPERSVAVESMAARLREEVKIRRSVEEAIEELRSKQNHQSIGFQDVENELRMQSELIAKLRKENQELLRCVGGNRDFEGLIKEIDQLRFDLKLKETEVRNIRSKMSELKKELRIMEQQNEQKEFQQRKNSHKIESEKKLPPSNATDPKNDWLKSELIKLQGEFNALKGRRPAAQVQKIKKKNTLNFSVCAYPLFCMQTDYQPVRHYNADIIGKLQRDLETAEGEMMLMKRKLEVDAQLELELEKLKVEKLHSECIAAKTKLEDAEYKIRTNLKTDELARIDEAFLTVQLELRATDSQLTDALEKIDSKSIEIVRLRSRILHLEFDKTELLRKAERAIDQCDFLKNELTATGKQKNETNMKESYKIRLAESESRISQLMAENEKLASDKKTLSARLRKQSTPEITEELIELRKQREQDKAAISEAERVLSLVEQTEAKYLKVARENAKLRKDIAALNDDTFWSDLEALQSQHKLSMSLLGQCKSAIHDKRLLNMIEDLIGPTET